MHKLSVFVLLCVLCAGVPVDSNAMDVKAMMAYLKTIPPVRVSMLHREGRSLVFAISHPYHSCSPVAFRQGGDSVQLIAPKKAGKKCKKPRLSSVLNVPVTDKEIIEGKITILLPKSWVGKAQTAKSVFLLRDENFDPFKRERLQILNRRL